LNKTISEDGMDQVMILSVKFLNAMLIVFGACKSMQEVRVRRRLRIFYNLASFHGAGGSTWQA
jgi:hypothetical protein